MNMLSPDRQITTANVAISLALIVIFNKDKVIQKVNGPTERPTEKVARTRHVEEADPAPAPVPVPIPSPVIADEKPDAVLADARRLAMVGLGYGFGSLFDGPYQCEQSSPWTTLLFEI